MFILEAGGPPADRIQMEAALTQALGQLVGVPAQNGRQVVSLVGGEYPHLAGAHINLDNATPMLDQKQPPPVKGIGKRTPGIVVDQFAITAHPLRFRDAGVQLDVTAEQTVFEFDSNADGETLLLLTQARNGQIKAHITTADIEKLLLAGAKQAAASKGVAIEETVLKLRSVGPRSIEVHLNIRAKKAFFSANVPITGRLMIDDRFNATISDLACHGEGPVGLIVSSLVTPRLENYNGMQVPLMAFSLGDVKLRDIQLQTQNGLAVQAAFGS